MKIFCVGIGGIGLSAVAQWFRKTGNDVSGMDREMSEITEMLEAEGIKVSNKEDASFLDGVNLLVYSDAIPSNNFFRKDAELKKITQISYAEALGMLSKDLKNIAVAGSHGKSTTSALLAHMLTVAGLDPTAVVGTKVKNLGNKNFRWGESGIAVMEADEYREHFLHLSSSIGIITNVDYDHVDAFPTEREYQDAFIKFSENVKDLLILRLADESTSEIFSKTKSKKIALFGFEEEFASVKSSESFEVADVFLIRKLAGSSEQQKFLLLKNGQEEIELTTAFFGDHVLLDIAAAFAAVSVFPEIPKKVWQDAVSSFAGTWRRFELVGEYNGSEIISDYAHHPTELKALIAAARARFSNEKLLLVFQSHHGARTKAFAKNFMEALKGADEVLVVELYDVAGRERAEDAVDVESWAKEIQDAGIPATYAKDLDAAEKLVREKADHGTLVVIAGAGSIDKVARNLVKDKS